MDELKMIENDFLALALGLPDELEPHMKTKIAKSTIENFFNYLRNKLETLPPSE